nr:hypothetical protein [uncultured Fluviicola sp.]
MDYKNILKERHEELLKRKEEISIELGSINTELSAISELFKLDTPKTAVVKPAITSDKYPVEGTLKDRIVYTLQQIGSGGASDIENFMRQHESKVSSNSVTITASQLLKGGVIKGYKQGLKNIYSL